MTRGVPLPRNVLRFIPVVLAIVLSASSASASTIRIEENDKSIVYSGNWFTNGSSLNSSGNAVLTNSKGATATISFNGSGIRWLGVKDGWAGLANVYLDGALQIIDTYGDGAFQQVVFSAEGLSPGLHKLSIEVLHERGTTKTDGSWVWIDAFDIEDGAPIAGGITAPGGRVEENDPSLAYEGRWYPNSNPAHSSGHAVLAMDGGNKVSVTFNGTGISWIAYRDEWSGMARVFIDGTEKITIDTYLSPSHAQTVPYSVSGLPFGKHTIRIEVTGTHNESSKGSWVWLDAFDVTQ